jgi:hypothetical protein
MCLATGCRYGYPVSPIEAPGIYDASSSVGTETLHLQSRQQYVLRFRDRTGAESVVTGRWWVVIEPNEWKIGLEGLSSGLPGFPRAASPKGEVILSLGRGFPLRKIRLYEADKPDAYYSKRL